MRLTGAVPPSMGPRPNGRGKLLLGPVLGRTGRPSMGPRPNGRGKAPITADMITPIILQWGRGQTAAERCNVSLITAYNDSLQWGRGQTAAERGNHASANERVYRPSMGPRPNGRGKVVCTWRVRVSSTLQWGRGQTAAESLVGGAAGAHGKRPSMGPRPNGRGKRPAWRPPPCSQTPSMGPRPNGRGKHVQALCPLPKVPPSMGPRPNGRGKLYRVLRIFGR